MKTMMEVQALENGAHRNQSGDFAEIPDGYIEVPESLMDAYTAAVPFMDLTIEDGVLTGITALPKPEPEAITPPPTVEERLAAVEAYQLEQLLGD